MSWFTGQDGQQVWVQRAENVFTVILSPSQLPTEQLTYLSTQSKKAVYQEHIIQDELLDGKSKVPKRQRQKQAGQQRGFIVRADIEDSPVQRVMPCFKAVVQYLVDQQVVSRVDAEEAANLKKKKKMDKAMPTPKANELQVETICHVSHFAHGPGFRLEVAEGSVMQKLHLFTDRKDIPFQDWHEMLIKSIKRTGSHVMLAKKVATGSGEGQAAAQEVQLEGLSVQQKKDKAQKQDDAWLESMMSSCMPGAPGEDTSESEAEDNRNGTAECDEKDEKEEGSLPPWLQQRGPPTSRNAAARDAEGEAEDADERPTAADEEPAWKPSASRSAVPRKPAAPPATSRSQQLREQLQVPEWRRQEPANPSKRVHQSAPNARAAPASAYRAAASAASPYPAVSVWANPDAVAGAAVASAASRAAAPRAAERPVVVLDSWEHAEADYDDWEDAAVQPTHQPQAPNPRWQRRQRQAEQEGQHHQPQQRFPDQEECENQLQQLQLLRQKQLDQQEGRQPQQPQQPQHQQQQRQSQQSQQQSQAAQPRVKREPIGPRRQQAEPEAQEWGQAWQTHDDQWSQGWHESGSQWQPSAEPWEPSSSQWHQQDWQHAPQQQQQPQRRQQRQQQEQQQWQEQSWEQAPQEAPQPSRKQRQQQSQQREGGQAPAPSAEPQAQAGVCGACLSGKPKKLYTDDTDGQLYCKKCWSAFYGTPPTA